MSKHKDGVATNLAAMEPLAVDSPRAAELLGISERLLWSKTNTGEIPHVKIGRSVRYPVHELKRWLSEAAAKN